MAMSLVGEGAKLASSLRELWPSSSVSAKIRSARSVTGDLGDTQVLVCTTLGGELWPAYRICNFRMITG